jgi:MerR family transcriptional regulator, thiopeptide resistance regulator
MSRTYRIREFAELAGVTVRALHHYDRLGLLEPKRTATGYREYCAKDLEALEQIVALKFIGLPLGKIKLLLKRGTGDLASALRAQRTILDQKRRLLDRAIRAISEAETALQKGNGVDSEVFKHIIEVIEMQNKTEEWKKQYDLLVQGKIERLKAMSPDVKTQLQKEWSDLLTDIGAALNEDPASPKAQALVSRWATLMGAFAPAEAVDPELLKKFGASYSPSDWPDGAKKPEGQAADSRIWVFMRRALAVRK